MFTQAALRACGFVYCREQINIQKIIQSKYSTILHSRSTDTTSANGTDGRPWKQVQEVIQVTL